MKPTLTTPDTLILSIWQADRTTAIVGSLRRDDDTIVADVLTGVTVNEPCTTVLCTTLAEVALIGAKHLLILTNDRSLAAMLSTPLIAPKADQVERKWLLGWGKEGQRGAYVDLPFGGDAEHWRLIEMLAVGQWAGCWRVQYNDQLTKARELWQRHTNENNGKTA